MKSLLVVLCGLFLIDWTLGALCAAGQLPLIAIPIVNFPFGIPHYWFESHWTGTQYVFDGRGVSENYSWMTWLMMVALQSVVYWGVWQMLHRVKPQAPKRIALDMR